MYERVPRHQSGSSCSVSPQLQPRRRFAPRDGLRVRRRATFTMRCSSSEYGRYLSETQVLQWFAPIATACALHAHGIVHRDLKSLNIVLNEVVAQDLRPRHLALPIGGDGLHAVLAARRRTELRGGVQPATEKSDVWALGVLPYELSGLRLPSSPIRSSRSRTRYCAATSRRRLDQLPELTEPVRWMLQLDAITRRSSVDAVIQKGAGPVSRAG